MVLSGAALDGATARGAVTASAQSRPAVFIVAVRDSRALTMCPDVPEVKFAGGGGWKPDGQVMTRPDPRAADLEHVVIMPRRRPVAEKQQRRFESDQQLRRETAGASLFLPTPAGARNTGGTTGASLLERVELGTDRLGFDRPVEQALAKEFVRLNRYAIVDSPEKADFVFFAEASYVAQVVQRKTGQSSGSVSSIQPGDWVPNLRQSVLAIMVAADVYRRSPGDIGALLGNRTWEGSAVYQAPYQYNYTPSPVTGAYKVEELNTYEPASPEAVVRQLHGLEPRMPSHPVLCAASNEVFQTGSPTLPRVLPAAPGPEPAVPREAGAPATTAARGAQTAAPPVATFRSDVTYVPVPVVLTDGDGHSVPDVPASDFRIFEDDVEQKIDRVIAVSQPFNVALLVDSSISMRSKLAEVQEAALGFVDAVRPDDRLMLLSFDRRVFVQADLATDRERLRRAIFQMKRDLGTRLYDAVALTAEYPSLATVNRKAIVVLTDGLDTQSRLADAGSTLAGAAAYNGAIYAIQYDTTEDNLPRPTALGAVGPKDVVPAGALDPRAMFSKATEYLQAIAASTGGRFYRASALTNLADAFAQIAKDLGGQYTLCYYPLRQDRDGTYRRIRVEVNRPGVTVRTRAGYRAPGEGAK